jgi:hypothetical protein
MEQVVDSQSPEQLECDVYDLTEMVDGLRAKAGQKDREIQLLKEQVKHLSEDPFNDTCKRISAAMDRTGEMELRDKLIRLRTTTMSKRKTGRSYKAITEELWDKIEKLTAKTSNPKEAKS